jgi:hypothetical protein
MLLDGPGQYLAAMKREESLKGKDDGRNAAAVVLCLGHRGLDRLGNFCNCLRYSFRLVLQGQNIVIAHRSSRSLCAVARDKTEWIWAHPSLIFMR